MDCLDVSSPNTMSRGITKFITHAQRDRVLLCHDSSRCSIYLDLTFTYTYTREHALTVHGSRFICPRCGTKCYNAKKFKAHGDAQSCQAIRREPSNLEPEVMTLVQEKVLDMGFNAKCSTEEKWRLMYNEFFPQEEQSNCPDPCEFNTV